MFEIFEHTADVGLRVQADDLDHLLADAGCALFSVLVVNLGDIEPVERIRCHIKEPERDYLLLDWLNELLFRFESQRLLLNDFDVHVDDQGLEAEAAGEVYDPRRHQLAHEVKAITYHRLRVELTDRGWEAEVILDL